MADPNNIMMTSNYISKKHMVNIVTLVRESGETAAEDQHHISIKCYIMFLPSCSADVLF